MTNCGHADDFIMLIFHGDTDLLFKDFSKKKKKGRERVLIIHVNGNWYQRVQRSLSE